MRLVDRIKRAATAKLKHIRFDGSISTDITHYCPECGFPKPERTVLPGVDFDEHGWYQVEQYTCQNTDCGHTWKEKVIVQGGGRVHYYGGNPRG